MSKQTINGVPRELLEELRNVCGDPGIAEEVRALLDAPDPVKANRLGPHHVLGAIHNVPGFPGVKGNHIHDLTALLNGVLDEAAAQPQGEPVAWQYRVSAGPQTGWSLWHDGKGEEFKQSYQVETRPLYAEQPAPEGTTSDKYRAELYDEVWQKARDLGFSSVTEALRAVSGPQKYDDTLLPFLALMRKELHANSDKGDREGWLGMSAESALCEIDHHSAKLKHAVHSANAELIREHAADVANCAMMVVDVCGDLDRA